MSTRLRPLTDETPKCLLEVGGVPILKRALEVLESAGIREHVIVVGYRHEMIRDAVRGWVDDRARFVENAEYAHTNTCASVRAARSETETSDFLLLDGDVIFSRGVLDALLSETHTLTAALRPTEDLGDEEVKVSVAEDGRTITAISKSVPVDEAVGEAIGIYRIDAEAAPWLYRTLDERIEQRGLTGELYEASFQQMIDEGAQFRTVDVGAQPVHRDRHPRGPERSGAGPRRPRGTRFQMKRLASYLNGKWTEGTGAARTLVNPSTEEPVAELADSSAHLESALRLARDKGGPALRRMSFAERAGLVGKLGKIIGEHRDELLGLAMTNGAGTRGDAKFDVDGAAGTLAYYAKLGESLGEARVLADDEPQQLTRSPRLVGQHLWVPRHGVAVHINAFNFPAWGPMEKAACALVAGMPVITKPATATALVTHRMTELFVDAGVLPEGTFQLLMGPVGDLLDQLTGQDVLAFTGSSDTGQKLRSHPNVVARGVRVNVEADSLNAAVVGPDVEPGSPTWDMLVGEIAKEITQKAGQKCTAIRRVLVPEARTDALVEALGDRLAHVTVGVPEYEGVGMGPLATRQQLDDVRTGLGKLKEQARTAWGASGEVEAAGASAGKGYFMGPVLLVATDTASATVAHELEVFGPVATLFPYDGQVATAAALVARGAGGLVTSAFSDDRDWLRDLVLELAPYNGRLYLGSDKIADKGFGHGTVLPQLVHGGPGRAGGGEELGGRRGLELYMQRTAISGDKAILATLT